MESMAHSSVREYGWTEMDRQHRSIVASIDFLEKAPRYRTSDLPELRRILLEMGEHFHWEEAQMLALGYPDLHRHKSDHHRQMLNLLDLYKLVDEGNETLDADFFVACGEWNIRHIRSMDGDFMLFRDDREAWDLQQELKTWEYETRLASHPD
jgi:hemerythrin-like metal-binding protein